MVGVVAVGQLARTLLEVYRDVSSGGIVVHSKEGKVLIDNDPRFSSGTLIIVLIEENKALIQLLEALTNDNFDLPPSLKQRLVK